MKVLDLIQNIEYIDTTPQELQEFLQKSEKKTDINFEESELVAFFSDAKSVKLLSKEINSSDDIESLKESISSDTKALLLRFYLNPEYPMMQLMALVEEFNALVDESVGFLFTSVGDESRDIESLKISIATLH